MKISHAFDVAIEVMTELISRYEVINDISFHMNVTLLKYFELNYMLVLWTGIARDISV